MSKCSLFYILLFHIAIITGLTKGLSQGDKLR